MLQIIGYYGFTAAAAAILAVNYFDRLLIQDLCLRQRLQKIELLVLSTLKWKMNLVTPLSFMDHIMKRFGFMNKLHLDFLKKCERLILDIALDNLDECHDLILELIGTSCYKFCQSLKRKHQSVPGNPSGVIDTYFRYERSNDSWICEYTKFKMADFTKKNKDAKAKDDLNKSTLRNSSLGLCQCKHDAWKNLQKRSWNSIISLYEDRILDVEIVGGVSGSVAVTIEEGLEDILRLHEDSGVMLSFSITFHTQTDGQSERMIQVPEDKLRACVIDFGSN
ncbi:hypothetical protein BC332_28539 [Capsicum chinense]|nr:hypothetical protein BC332_28539 [Capsicum chinense]